MAEKRAAKKADKTEEPVIVAYIRHVLRYDANTGVFTRASGARAGTPINTRHSAGYICISVLGEAFLAHRLAWLYVHGRWPSAQLDHINGIRTDNRLANLRECTNAENCQNVRAHRDGAGLIGASFDRRSQKWQAGIGVNGKRINLGYFATATEAHQAYVRAKTIYHTFGATNA